MSNPRVNIVAEFLERRCGSLYMDNERDRRQAALLLVGMGLIAPDPDRVYQAILASHRRVMETVPTVPTQAGAVKVVTDAEIDQLARNAAQALVSLFSEAV